MAKLAGNIPSSNVIVTKVPARRAAVKYEVKILVKDAATATAVASQATEAAVKQAIVEQVTTTVPALFLTARCVESNLVLGNAPILRPCPGLYTTEPGIGCSGVGCGRSPGCNVQWCRSHRNSCPRRAQCCASLSYAGPRNAACVCFLDRHCHGHVDAEE